MPDAVRTGEPARDRPTPRGRDPSTPFLLTIEEEAPFAVDPLSYGQVVAHASLLADELARAGVEPGDHVGCYLPQLPELGGRLARGVGRGGVVAAVGTLVPPAEAARLFAMAGVRTVVTVMGVAAPPGDFRVVRIGDDGLLEGHADTGEIDGDGNDLPLPSGDDPRWRSSRPGRRVSRRASPTRTPTSSPRHDGWRPGTAHERVPAGSRAAHLAPGVVFNPFGHMAGYNRLGFRMWIGRPTVIVPKFTVGAVRALLARFDMDSLQLTPTMVHMLATTDDGARSRWRQVRDVGDGAAVDGDPAAFESRYGVPVMQAYGLSEVGAVAQERYDDVVAGRRGPGSVGRIAAGVEVEIRRLDDDRPAGEGEILVRTDEASSEFIGGEPVPLDEDGWFATGDVGRIDDEILYITGRVQEKIIVGGFNVYPAEVEDAARRSALRTRRRRGGSARRAAG